MLFNIASIASVAILGSVVSAAGSGQTVQIKSASNWCMMMPPQEGGGIAASEGSAVAFCTNQDSDAPGAKIFPSGFIQSAHFATGNGYVQVTGKIDRTRYSLNANDQGGQYDIVSPAGSACAGYSHYVNLIEPNENIYCIRCCKDTKDCNIGKPTSGCEAVVPGDYSGGSGSVTALSGSAGVATPTSAVPASAVPTSGTLSATSPISTASANSSISGTSSISSASTATVTANTTLTTVSTGTVTSSVTPTQKPNAAVAQNQPFGLLGVAAVVAVAMLAL